MADTPETVVPDSAETPASGLSTLGQPVKVTGGGKGVLSTITPTSGAILSDKASETILSNMQKMLDEYNSPLKRGQEALQKAHAWTMYDKQPAFRNIQEQEQQQQANKYNLSQSMAGIQAMREQNKIIASTMGGTGAAGTTAGVPGAYSGPMANEVNSLPESQRRWAAALAQTNPQELMKIVQQNELKKPDTLKVLSAIKGMDDTAENRAYLQQNYPELFKPQTRIVNGVGQQYSPDISGLFKGKAPTSAPTGVPSFSDPSINITSAQRNAKQGKDLYQTSVDAGTPGTQPNGIPVAKPGTSPHETLPLGDVLDIDPNKLTTSGRTELAQKGYYQPYGKDSPHWQKIPPQGTTAPTVPAMRASLTDAPATTPITPAVRPLTAGEADTTVPGVALQYKNAETANAAVGKVYETLITNKTTYQDAITSADRVINAINSAKEPEQGPGTDIKQAYIYAKIATGVPVDPEELAAFSNNLTIDQAVKQYVAHGAKAAMGSQYTGKESENFEKSLATIKNPPEFIKTTFQILKAKNLVDLAHAKFLGKYQKDLVGGENAWDESGEREKIFKETVTAFNKTPAAKAPSIEAQAKQRFKSYEPDKYNYGTDEKGLYREPK